MKAPIGRLKKDEIIALYKGRCKHGHRYLEHYDCFLRDGHQPLRIGFLDIETSNLAADFGIVFCYRIKEAGSAAIHGRIITAYELDDDLDKKVVEQAIRDIVKFDVIVTYYGTKFDLPFLRTRALYWKLSFPGYGMIQHKDVFYIIKGKFRLSRSRLETAARLLLGKTEKNHIESAYWIKALRGDEKSLAYIDDHCKRDVRDLERLYNAVIGFSQNTTRSI